MLIAVEPCVCAMLSVHMRGQLGVVSQGHLRNRSVTLNVLPEAVDSLLKGLCS